MNIAPRTVVARVRTVAPERAPNAACVPPPPPNAARHVAALALLQEHDQHEQQQTMTYTPVITIASIANDYSAARRAASTISAKLPGSRLAPPTRAPSTSVWPPMASAFAGLDASAVEEPAAVRRLVAADLGEAPPDVRVGVLGLVRRRRPTGADRPTPARRRRRGRPISAGVMPARLPSSWRPSTVSVSPASRWSSVSPTQTIGVSPASIAGPRLAGDDSVVFPEELPSLGVPRMTWVAPAVHEHARADLAGERPLGGPVKVLPGDRDPRVPAGVGDCGERRERRRENDVGIGDGGHTRRERRHEGDGVRHRLVHLPVGGEQRCSHGSGGLLPQPGGTVRCWRSAAQASYAPAELPTLPVRARARRQAARPLPAASGRQGTRAMRRRRSRCA